MSISTRRKNPVMNLYEILNNINQLQVYSETEWEEYINFFETADQYHFSSQLTPEPSGNELQNRILSRTGAKPVTVDDSISPKIVNLESMLNERHKNEMTLGVVSGAFDLLHLGHLKGIQYAKNHLQRKENGKLCALILADHDIHLKKGDSRPVLNLNERLTMLTAVQLIDYIVPLEESNCFNALEILKPNIFFKSKKDFHQEIVIKEIELVKNCRGNIDFFPDLPNKLSTTQIFHKISGS